MFTAVRASTEGVLHYLLVRECGANVHHSSRRMAQRFGNNSTVALQLLCHERVVEPFVALENVGERAENAAQRGSVQR